MARGKIKAVLMLDEDNNIIAGYKNISVASSETGVSRQTIYSQCVNNTRGRGKYHFVFDIKKKEEPKQKSISIAKYVVQEEQPIIKKERKDMLVNILVGIVNGTLEDKTIIKIANKDYFYDAESGKLKNPEGEDIISILYSKKYLVDEIVMELPLLEGEDRIYLKTIISRMNNIKGIRKIATQMDREFLRIEFENPDDVIVLPEFKQGQYYVSLEKNRLYSLEELNLR